MVPSVVCRQALHSRSPGHRDSIDFDFFGNRALTIAHLERQMPFLSGAKVVDLERLPDIGAARDAGPIACIRATYATVAAIPDNSRSSNKTLTSATPPTDWQTSRPDPGRQEHRLQYRNPPAHSKHDRLPTTWLLAGPPGEQSQTPSRVIRHPPTGWPARLESDHPHLQEDQAVVAQKLCRQRFQRILSRMGSVHRRRSENSAKASANTDSGMKPSC
jgi:hypothetical protein